MKRTMFLLLFLMVALFAGCTNPSTPPGHEGYVKENPRVT